MPPSRCVFPLFPAAHDVIAIVFFISQESRSVQTFIWQSAHRCLQRGVLQGPLQLFNLVSHFTSNSLAPMAAVRGWGRGYTTMDKSPWWFARPPAALVDSYGCISVTCDAAAALTLTFLHGLPKWSWTVNAHGVRRFIFSHHMMWRRAQVAAGTTLAHYS